MNTQLQVAIALSLYHYNVSPAARAMKLYKHFKGDCMELEDMVELMVNHPGSLITDLPMPTAAVYVHHAMERYGEEALQHVLAADGEVLRNIVYGYQGE